MRRWKAVNEEKITGLKKLDALHAKTILLFLPYLQEGSKALYDAYVNVQVDSVNNNNNIENEEEVKKS